MTTPNGIDIIENGWRFSGIQGAIKLGSKDPLSIDPFKDIDPLVNNNEAANGAN